MRLALATMVAFGLAFSVAVPEPAAADGRKSVAEKRAAKKVRMQKRRQALQQRRRGPQVRGFRTRVGGYSYGQQETYLYNPHVPPPQDFGPHLDVTPAPNGILPTGSYID
ncbi:MAG: hypothetical protein MI824_00050 [Hyphomicrobiales bacterium]|nr:hypothetical protein [Hyphomicrobiales bacterium]